MTWESEVEEYREYLLSVPRSEVYIRNSGNYLTALGKALNPASFLAISRKDLTEWLLKVKEHGISGRGPIADASYNTIKAVIRAAFRRLSGTRKGETGPENLRDIVITKNPSRASFKKDLPSDEQITAIAKVMNPQKRAILLTIRYTGARPSEVLRLKREDVAENFDLAIRKTKTQSPRTAALVDRKAQAALRDWMAQAPKEGYLFPGQKPGTPLGYQSFWLTMKTAARKAGVPEEKAVPYFLRHAFITAMSEGENPMPETYLIRQVGFKSSAMLQNYTRADPDMIRASMEARSPREEMTVAEAAYEKLWEGIRAVQEAFPGIAVVAQLQGSNPEHDRLTRAQLKEAIRQGRNGKTVEEIFEEAEEAPRKTQRR